MFRLNIFARELVVAAPHEDSLVRFQPGTGKSTHLEFRGACACDPLEKARFALRNGLYRLVWYTNGISLENNDSQRHEHILAKRSIGERII
jgi:hypothetical protein